MKRSAGRDEGTLVTPPRPKLGFIFECQSAGPDFQVYEVLAKRLIESREAGPFEMVPRTLGDKKKVVAQCGDQAKIMLAQGCIHVFICWDLAPNWLGKNQAPCRREDRNSILTNLTAAGVPHADATLVCIQRHLEAWLIADEAAVAALCRRSVSVPKVNDPEKIAEPKHWLWNQCQTTLKIGAYRDSVHAKKIAATADMRRLKRVSSFDRFATKLRAVCPP